MVYSIKRSMFLLIALFITTATFLSGCNFGESEDEIELAEVTRSVFYAPQYVAISEGFFEDEGLDVELTTTWGGDNTMTTLLSDGADIALVGAETSIYVYGQEAVDPAINFAQLTETDGTFLVGREEHENFEWGDLEGASFLGQREGGMPQMVGEYVLREHGIDPHEDLDLNQGVDFENIPSAFASGDEDYVQLFEPQATQFEEEEIGHVLGSFGTESGNVPYTVYMSKQSFLEENDEQIEKFTRAIHRAQQWVHEQSAEEVAESIQEFFDETDKDTIAQSVERYRDQGSYAESPLLDEDGWYLLQEIMEDAGELPEHVEYDTLVETDFAERVE
ncbi:ABC transporter substrate-binding protein [Texcoconibacillus texcoconensis]|uniref:NitT/TauT family transport system substrate-binding protein n=1 Tax=Texcoconibacillus texcoconensis TaxID=1095777 RepID=A0A840QN73_9BACI|nr:ABC transporter substrate-binding protein [Texcoconibacillus texcoconensis]MBB5172824.1 NitT/TauT family transport system substrate-binding protein [Texcoconibacillus texcoconensis]